MVYPALNKLTLTIEGEGGSVKTTVDLPLDSNYVKMIYEFMVQTFERRTCAPVFGTVKRIGPIQDSVPQFHNPVVEVICER